MNTKNQERGHLSVADAQATVLRYADHRTVETVTLEEFLDAVSAVCVFAGVPHEVQLAVRRRFEHGRQSVLSRVTCA